MATPDWLTAILSPGTCKERWNRLLLAIVRSRFIDGFVDPHVADMFLSLFDDQGRMNRSDSRLMYLSYLRVFASAYLNERDIDNPVAVIKHRLSPKDIRSLSYGNTTFVFGQYDHGIVCHAYRHDDGTLYLFAFPMPKTFSGFLA